MHQFKMMGLRADNPQAWMAAVGLQFILAHQNKNVLLSWDGLTPVLFNITEREMMDSINQYIRDGSQANARISNLPRDLKKNKIALDFTAGQVILTEKIDQMVNEVKEQHILNSLTEPWQNEDKNIVSLGWDPVSIKQAATLAGGKPPEKALHRTQLGAQWLAAESLFVTCPHTISLGQYHWVTWSVPLDIEGVYSVIQAQTSAWMGFRYCSNIGFNGSFKFFYPSSRQ